MVLERVLSWLWYDLRPRSGWVAFTLLLLAVMSLAVAVSTAGWVPEVDTVYAAAFYGVLLTLFLIERRVPAWFAWPLLVGYGFVLSTLWLSEAYPGMRVLFGWESASAHIDVNLRLYWARIQSWVEPVFAGQSSRETIVFATLLVWVMWLLACFATWVTLKLYKPLHALSLLGVALAINNFYGDVTLMSVGLFVIVTVLLVSDIHFESMMLRWRGTDVDYSEEIRNELLLAAGAVALVLVFVATILPAIPYRELAQGLSAVGRGRVGRRVAWSGFCGH